MKVKRKVFCFPIFCVFLIIPSESLNVDSGCNWQECSASECPTGTKETNKVKCDGRVFFGGLMHTRYRRQCCDLSELALLRWAEGAEQAETGGEDACFNRCPVHAKCNERNLKCECVEGFAWVGSADARDGLCRPFATSVEGNLVQSPEPNGKRKVRPTEWAEEEEEFHDFERGGKYFKIAIMVLGCIQVMLLLTLVNW
eukprot:CAMPEP_0196594522 /NCGR_PEP_ID=MMETSP1081-20130531/78605_1 /TAXON_ID=36882 /ORGANISM="Pyramimonas amylifera, Strain CCMP720" /LENGTH=198 /DNA_ID=CAMNT_0041918813 /DNA_START=68 /DNA_END=661 /DNA_ORIENTATION=-